MQENMKEGDTSLGGSKRRFPDTTLGLLSRLGRPSSGDYREALEDLCSRYWKPIYRYLRIRWPKSNDDAKDLTQAFFLWLVEGEALANYAPERGSFRQYLKMLLGGFGGHRDRALQALKRGGGMKRIPMEGLVAQGNEPVDAKAPDPGAAFDREWIASLVKGSIDRVREQFTIRGRETIFQVYAAYDMAMPGTQPTYPELAARMGLKENEVRHHLVEVREAVRREIRAELARLTTDDRELEEEWNALFGS